MHWLLTGPLRVEQVTVPIRLLPEAMDGLKIAQLSDFHYDGLRLSDWLLQSVLLHLQDIQPDLIILTGDFVTRDPTPIWNLVQWLKQFPSRYGQLAILGNHDLLTPSSQAVITDALATVDIPVLWNQIAYPLGETLPFVGLADLWSPAFDPQPLMVSLDSQTPRIVLAHNPDSASHLQPWRVDLQCSGHTHGGQIVLPGIGPLPAALRQGRKAIPSLIRNQLPYVNDQCDTVMQHWEWSAGLHWVGRNRLYVNRGLGTYLPGRLWCPPELTVIRLTAV